MKTKSRIIKLLLVLVLVVLASGCFKRDDMEDISIITTAYPIEYVLTKLYGDNAIINSIYPDGVNINEYEISNKEYKDYSKQDLFVYNGLSNESDIALNLVNKNKDILIMDANSGMEIQYGTEELWLNPSNLLMISQNIKNGLSEIIDNKYLKKEIEEAYEELKVELSELDAEMKMLSEKANNKTLIIASPTLQYLAKYGFDIILLSDTVDSEKEIAKAKDLIDSENVKYVYILENDEENNALQKLKKERKIEVLKIDNIDNIDDEERDDKENYITLMNKNIELLRKATEA